MEDINGNCNPSFEVDIKLNGVTNVLEQGLKGLAGQGFTMQGEWSENILYKPYDVVTSNNGVFCCLLLNENSEPTDENPNWHKMLDTFQSEYESKEEERILDFNRSQVNREESYTSAEDYRDELYDKKENDITYEESREYRFVDSQNQRQSDYIAKEEEREVSYESKEQERENKYLIAETIGENSRENRFLAAENVRNEAEGIRLSNETTRGENEGIRLSNEITRGENESIRLSKESERVSSEEERLSKELIRIDNEDLRITKEGERQSQEETRRTNETNRIQEEDIRKSNESARIIGENSRDSRYLTAESVRDDNYIKAETTNANSREKRYVAAEALRNASVASKLTEINTTINNEVSRVDSKILEVNSVAERAEEAAIDAENITDSKIDKTAIKQVLGTSPTDVMSQKAITENINEYFNMWYGVSWNNSLSTIPSAKTRIGNSDLHRSLPVHSKMKGCLMADDGTIIKYLPDNSWVGETLDGTNGQVMVELPEYYFQVNDTDQTNVQLKISTVPLPNFEYSPKMYIGAYKGVIDRTIPATLKLASVVNTAVEFRGGNNNAANDSNENSLLGKASSAISGTNYRTYARNRNAGDTRWNRYTYEAWRKLVFLYLIEYANTNSQTTYNAALDVNGFKQGGLGMGVTQINSTKWGAFNGSYPFIPIGYSNSLGNGTGEIAFTMPYLYDGGVAYKGDYSADATYVAGNYIAAKYINKLYTCIADAPAGTLLSDTNYFTEVTRTTTLVNRYRGVELPFGEIFENLDGTLINADADNQNVKLYLCNNPKDYGDILTDKYIYRAELPTSSDYIKKMMLGKSGDILPLKDGLGASTSNGWGDYHYASIASSGLRALFVGGAADYVAYAGLVCSSANFALSNTRAYIGSRLCFIP